VESFLDHLESAVDEIMCKLFPNSAIVMARDFNRLTDTDLTQRTGLMQIVDQPTRGANTLDRIFKPRVRRRQSCNVGSQKRYHLAIIAYSGSQPIDLNKKRTILQHRPRPMLPFWLYLTRTGTMLSMQQTHKLLLAYFMLVFCRCCLVGYFLSIFLICVL